MFPSLNVLDLPLQSCSQDPVTGWYRDGCCNTDARDHGSHTVCVRVTTAFLEHLRDELGNDLMTPAPQAGFRGLRDGDQWCVCAASWYRAYRSGNAAPVNLQSTHKAALAVVPLEALMEYSIAHEA